MITEAHKTQIHSLIQKHGPYEVGPEIARILISMTLEDSISRDTFINTMKALTEDGLLAPDQLQFELYFRQRELKETIPQDSAAIEHAVEQVLEQLQSHVGTFNRTSRDIHLDPSYEGGTLARQMASLSSQGRCQAAKLFRLRPRSPSCE